MDVSAKITGIKYTPFLCRDLNAYNISDLELALSRNGAFLLEVDNRKQIALSWWVSAKRTRSYPYARIYDTLNFHGKKSTIIPILKDEGKEGDRDFLQWDTVSLMSLLGVYVIICYYKSAERSLRYRHKITNQRFDIQYIEEEVNNILSYQSDALHWNLAQIERVGEIGQRALDTYKKISKVLGVEMHSEESARKRINELLKGKEVFMTLSRGLAKKAQYRESITIQPKERLSGIKATLTIKNYLGGYYFFTCDEVNIDKRIIYLIEGKHSKQSAIPSLEDIKDGLVKMILFTNLKEVKIGVTEYTPVPILKLTTDLRFSSNKLRKSQISDLRLLKKEAEKNGFQVLINDTNLEEISL
ncbi:MAG: hypothetical protein LDL38_13505 [Flavobacterium piscis]|nr:hypothetical protein [Flavobacterium piscis]